ncbi:hypothetical protein ACH41H_29650 [Streptomyces sp. NPDC020800]|uniref:hypothetical protein n=1 Tax=Streptomyces sp. NPDC020800 TaxID=3365092 RepID=UPI0037A1C472
MPSPRPSNGCGESLAAWRGMSGWGYVSILGYQGVVVAADTPLRGVDTRGRGVVAAWCA